jgi:glycosyltransferase involved in cell wall biosynthesis
MVPSNQVNESGPLLITTRYSPYVGGQEQATEDLARELNSRGQRVTVLTETLGRTLDLDDMIYGINIVRLPTPEARTAMVQLRVAYRTARYVLRRRDSISWVLVRTYSASAVAIGLLKFLGLIRMPTMVTSDTGGAADDIRALRGYRLRRVFTRLLSHHDYLNALNVDNLESLSELGFPMAKITRIVNGVDVGMWEAAQRPVAVRSLVCVGRIEREKGVFSLLEAFDQVYRGNKDVTLDFIGSGSSEAELRTEIRARGLGSVVRVLGAMPHSELQGAYANYDCVVVPSPAEGFCLVAYEAMACRRILVTTDVADLKAVFGDSIIVCDSPKPDRLAAGMVRAIRGEAPGDDVDGAVRAFSIKSTTDELVKLMAAAGAS